MLDSTGQEESGTRQAGTRRLRYTRSADLPHSGAEGGARLDDPQGGNGSAGRWCHPHRLREGLHQGEIISFDDLDATGSVAEARAKGKARMEGKEYVMQDGDVCEWRFNV